LIDKNAFSKMKEGVILINCARGGIVNEKDLYDAIKAGKVARAALDVFEKEPAIGNPLLELEEVISTPHLGAATGEAQENVSIAIAQQIVTPGGGSQCGEHRNGEPGYSSFFGTLSSIGRETGKFFGPNF
jgi:phosphoglycerate dehydrogenase-like enzyme